MKKIYIYKIKCDVNNKMYIGQSTNPQRRFKQHLENNKQMKEDINKYGVDSFSLEILDECYEDNCGEVELKYIEMYDTVNNGYNVQWWSNSNCANVRRHKQWNTGLTKETDERVMKISKSLTGKYVGENSPIWGVPKSKEHKRKLSELRKLDIGEKNHFYGHHHTTEMKQHFSECKKGRKCMVKDNVFKFVKPDDIEKFIADGFRYATRKELIRFKSSGNKGMKYINNGDHNKMVKEDELNFYLNNGWVKGMIKKT